MAGGEIDFFGLTLVLPAPFDNEWGAFGFNILLWAGIAGVLVFLVRPAVRWVTSRTKSELDDKLVGILGPAVFVALVLVATRQSLSILESKIGAGLLEALFAVCDIGMILLGGYVAYRVFKEIVIDYTKRLARRTQARVEDLLIPAFDKLGAVVILCGTLVAIAARAGVDLSVLLAGGAFAGLVVGLAAQETLANFFAGLHIILDQPFKVGDTIQLESGEVVDVKEVGLRSCKLFNGYNGSVIIMPNQTLARSKIVNYTRMDRRFRVKIEVSVSYEADPTRVQALLKDVLTVFPDVITAEGFEPVTRLAHFGDSSMAFDLLFWIKDHTLQWTLASDVRVKILQRLKANGIEIPLPQRVVYFKPAAGATSKDLPSPAP